MKTSGLVAASEGRDLGTPPPFLVNAHAQTIWPALKFGGQRSRFRASRERWCTPDGDFVDVDRVPGPGDAVASVAPLLVLFHGLEGSAASHYVQSFAAMAAHQGFAFALPHFRGCSGELNTAPRAYHSGDHAEIDWVLRQFKAEAPDRPVVAVGVSLGGNALMHWAGLHGSSAREVVAVVAAVSSPLDLQASGHAMGRGFNRHVYTRMFLNTMRPKALLKWAQHPGLFDRQRLLQARTLYEFDNVFTAPVHGFADTHDYWRRASAKPGLVDVAVPSVLLNALNDPFVPHESLPKAKDVSKWVSLWHPEQGGHVGFPAAVAGRPWAFHVDAMPAAVVAWLKSHLPHKQPF